MFDALFVNVEFLPGAILLQRLGAKEFAYGAATMFRKTTFLERVNWADLGSQLADDHELGRRLSPVVVVGAIVSTFTLPGSWHDALQHYYRWQKTVRWCRPIGFAAVILVIPMIGWTTMLLWTGSRAALAGFAGQWLLEVFVGIIICSLIGCRLSPRTWSGLLLWPLVRMVSWLATWLPLRVIWGQEETAWYSPKKNK
jgi:ceramide glucosyltransferase